MNNMTHEPETEQARSLCRGCVWNCAVWCGRDFCMLPACVHPLKEGSAAAIEPSDAAFGGRPPKEKEGVHEAENRPSR